MSDNLLDIRALEELAEKEDTEETGSTSQEDDDSTLNIESSRREGLGQPRDSKLLSILLIDGLARLLLLLLLGTKLSQVQVSTMESVNLGSQSSKSGELVDGSQSEVGDESLPHIENHASSKERVTAELKEVALGGDIGIGVRKETLPDLLELGLCLGEVLGGFLNTSDSLGLGGTLLGGGGKLSGIWEGKSGLVNLAVGVERELGEGNDDWKR